MIAPQTLLAWVDALGWTLLHFLWQGAALGVLYAALRPFCRDVASRYRLGMALLVAMLFSPILTLAYLAPDAATVVAAGAVTALPDVQVQADAAASALTTARFETLLPWLVAAWFLGASVIALRAFAHWRRLSWLVRNASIPLADCSEMLARLCRRFGIARRVRLLGSMAVDTPMLIGWLRPVILLPISMLSGFTPSQIELIIAHELGHVRRWDYLANLVQVVIETVLFYHPVVHWISRDVRDARESCCDDLVLTLADGSPVVYASALAELEQLRHDGALAAPALAASGGVLLERIRRIVGAQSVLYDPLPRSGGWPVVLLVAVGMLAALRLHAPANVTPAQAVAMLSGNPRLAEPAPAAVPTTVAPPLIVAAPKPAAVEPNAAAQPQPTEAAPPIIPVARPRIVVASAAPLPLRAGDIRERIAAVPAIPAPAAEATEASEVRATMPRALVRVQPEYPVHEKIRGVTGKVDLQFGIERDGSVTDVRVLQSSPENVFDRVAINALKQWRFAAGGVAGQVYTQSFAFALAGIPAKADSSCREVIGSHICRHVAAGDEALPPP
jgi:TonB family protein